MNPNTFNPANLPTVLPERSIPLPRQSLTSSVDKNALGPEQDIYSQIRSRPPKQNIYQKYFGHSFGTGKATVFKNFGGGLLGGKLHKGLVTTLKAFRRNSSGSGKNLSYKDIEHISNKIGDTLKKLPTNKSYDSNIEHIRVHKQRKLIRSFKQDVKAGKISKADLDDVKHIIKNTQI